MKELVSAKIKGQLEKIIAVYFDLFRLELDNFRLVLLFEGVSVENVGEVFIANSSCSKKINKRRQLLGETFYSQKKDIVNSFFLNLAKLFDAPKRNKPKSIPILVKTITNNYHLFEKTEDLKKAIDRYEERINKSIKTINLVKEHRDKCLAHNDNNVECCHLKGLSTNETREVMETIKSLVNSVCSFFEMVGILDSELEKIKDASFTKNIELLDTFEPR